MAIPALQKQGLGAVVLAGKGKDTCVCVCGSQSLGPAEPLGRASLVILVQVT